MIALTVLLVLCSIFLGVSLHGCYRYETQKATVEELVTVEVTYAPLVARAAHKGGVCWTGSPPAAAIRQSCSLPSRIDV